MESRLRVSKRAKLVKTDTDYFAKLKYGYLTVAVAILSFVAILIVDYFLVQYSDAYFNLLVLYSNALHGFIRTCLIIILSIIPVIVCKASALINPVVSISFYFISLIVLGFPLGVAISVLPELIIPVAVQVTVLTLLFCSIGIIFKKDLSSWGSILSFGLVGIISMTFTNWQFLHLTFLNTISYYATVLLFLGYLIYDANMAMNSYTEAKELGGLFFVSLLLANSLDILQDIIVLFLEILTSDSDDDSDNDSDGGFDSFW
ncbi:hypothetical protein FC48_GL001111 [Ligilactobacillus murinus DSM 20452 = NBRC 14221]|uniref:Integral membrane protein n=1 Tax=Ligilactobacillus murinus DSM 20452 = NBRC 14221 TaxID=1423772 RepID=A0A0R2B5L0_9LACO|nr:Bax inhibitor-1 family protein [Ligilactobacillus murinus]KRM73220.1 hypothetical protein FC48_GL001111 [Ligilactobacillus murinus DSM 20452 = NBRC 14221]TGY50766.1 hypothetical protein E5341_11365 [Ligilactobacillus murinus]